MPVPTPGPLDPIETIALNIARADMHYVASSLIGLPDIAAAAEIPVLQYGVMAAYEAQIHFAKTLRWKLEAGWDHQTAESARMSGKFFADRERNLQGVVDHFERLIHANHGAFFPPDRRGKIYDFLRDDLSVVALGDSPCMSIISAHYLTGLEPSQESDLATVGPAVGRLSRGVGRIAGALLRGSGIEMHSHAPVPQFAWMDGKSAVAMPRLFGGELDAPLASALQTVQSIALSAANSAARAGCTWCISAAKKHRFVALYQSLMALKILRGELGVTALPGRVLAFLDSPDAVWLLQQSKLRNGLVHLGLQDIAAFIKPGGDVDQVVYLYTSEEPDEFAGRVSGLLEMLVSTLTDWMLEKDLHGNSFMEALGPANVD